MTGPVPYKAGDIAEVEGRVAVYVPTRWEWLDGYWTALPGDVGPVLGNVYDVAHAAQSGANAAATATSKRPLSWPTRWAAYTERRRNSCRVTTEWQGSFIGRRHCMTHDVVWDEGDTCPRVGTAAHSAPFEINPSRESATGDRSSCG